MQQHEHLNRAPEVDYALIASAIAFYEKLGYEHKHLPWAVPRAVSTITAPVEKLVPLNDEFDLVGSAEQSFIWKFIEEKLEGTFLSVTPCFRREPIYDELHYNYFMKLELFSTEKHANDLIDDALKFFRKFIDIRCDTIVTDDGVDIVCNGIELGSYGFRSIDSRNWAYGTGLSLPRATNIG